MDDKDVLAKKNLKAIADSVEKPYDNLVLERVNDHCLRMAVMQREYPWHYHEHTDELFIVVEGELKIEVRGGETVFLKPGEFMKMPAKTIHRTSAATRTVNLCFEMDAEDTVFVE